VIKIEPLKGEALRGAGQQVAGSSYLFHINNAGKKSVCLDPADPAGRASILALVAGADAWIENLAPGSLDAMQLGDADLRAVNPNLIYCSVSGYGHASAYGSMRALDTVVQASTGIMHLTGYPDHFPVKIGISAVDLAAAVALVGAVIGGLRERERTGTGLHVDLAMADVAVWMSQCFWEDVRAGRSPGRIGNRSARRVPHNVFRAADGEVAIAAASEAQWQRLRALLPAAGVETPDEIEAAVQAWTRSLPVAGIVAACRECGIPAAAVRTLADVFGDAGMRARKLVYEAVHPAAGNVWLLGNPILLSRTPAEGAGYAPTLGEHTSAVLDAIRADRSARA
jgi:crotonobetainyl-CoA:carnitine CoA-transferase CaiB-like acyl-CoA transferase